jgi:hypothetical protein
VCVCVVCLNVSKCVCVLVCVNVCVSECVCESVSACVCVGVPILTFKSIFAKAVTKVTLLAQHVNYNSVT